MANTLQASLRIQYNQAVTALETTGEATQKAAAGLGRLQTAAKNAFDTAAKGAAAAKREATGFEAAVAAEAKAMENARNRALARAEAQRRLNQEMGTFGKVTKKVTDDGGQGMLMMAGKVGAVLAAVNAVGRGIEGVMTATDTAVATKAGAVTSAAESAGTLTDTFQAGGMRRPDAMAMADVWQRTAGAFTQAQQDAFAQAVLKAMAPGSAMTKTGWERALVAFASGSGEASPGTMAALPFAAARLTSADPEVILAAARAISASGRSAADVDWSAIEKTAKTISQTGNVMPHHMAAAVAKSVSMRPEDVERITRDATVATPTELLPAVQRAAILKAKSERMASIDAALTTDEDVWELAQRAEENRIESARRLAVTRGDPVAIVAQVVESTIGAVPVVGATGQKLSSRYHNIVAGDMGYHGRPATITEPTGPALLPPIPTPVPAPAMVDDPLPPQPRPAPPVRVIIVGDRYDGRP